MTSGSDPLNSRVCVVCGSFFVPKSYRSLTCSGACKKERNDELRKERMADPEWVEREAATRRARADRTAELRRIRMSDPVNQAKEAERLRKRHRERKDTERAYNRKWAEDNKEQVAKTRAEWRRKNRDKENEQQRKRRETSKKQPQD